MTRSPALPWDSLTFHQTVSFAGDSSVLEALLRSDRFRRVDRPGVPSVEWVRRDCDEEPTPFAFGRVGLEPEVCVVEAFSEDWADELWRHVHQLTSGHVSRDETRALRWPELLGQPEAVRALGPEATSGGAARLLHLGRFVRMAWPFLPLSAQQGRTLHELGETPSGRERIRTMLPELWDDLITRWPELPAADAEDLEAHLFPEPSRPSAPATKPADRRSV